MVWRFIALVDEKYVTAKTMFSGHIPLYFLLIETLQQR